jgi:cell division septation protein DedD
MLLVCFTLLWSAQGLSAQTAGSEEEVKKKAAELFENEDYAAAFPLYSQLLANYPKDPNYNYRFGVCMLYSSADKTKAVPYLETASNDPSADKDVWYHLGRAYHLNYRFDDAVKSYTRYKVLAGKKTAVKMQVDNQIAMCNTGKKLLKSITELGVIEKKELPKGDFFRTYDLKGYNGQLIVKPDDFKTQLDKKKKETSVIVLSGEKNELYFSSFGDSEDRGKDIYVVRRLPNGGWSAPYNLGPEINTEFDEDYPFLHPSGKVLYFCSKGHNSMGGYDIFRSELNEETNTWQKPVNMDFPINSPDDDILFITDYDEKSAWFASSRSSRSGMMMVYHVLIERRQATEVVITGTFKGEENDPSKKSTIIVKNADNGQMIGIFKSNEQTGSYFINLPNDGSKYTFTVEKNGVNTQTATVLIPPQYEIKPIRQEIGYIDDKGDRVLYINTTFDDDTASLSPEFLAGKAQMNNTAPVNENYEIVDVGNPNADNNPDNNTTDPADNVPFSNDPVSNQQVVGTAKQEAEEAQKDAVSAQQQADRAYTYATDLNNEAKEKQADADKALAAAQALPEGPEKQTALTDAAQKQAEANAAQAQAVAAVTVANSLDQDAKTQKQEADAANKYANTLDKALIKNDKLAMDQLSQQEQELQALTTARQEGASTVANYKAEADKKQQALDAAKTELQDIKDENVQNQQKIDQLKAEEAKEKDPDLKAGIVAQIEGIEEDIAANNDDIKKQEKKVQRLENEYNDANNKAQAANNTIAQSRNTEIAPVATSPEAKKQLEQDINTYQQSAMEAGTSRPVAATNPTETKTIPPDPIADNSPSNNQPNNNVNKPSNTNENNSNKPVVNNSGNNNSNPTNPQNNGSENPVNNPVNNDTNPVTNNNANPTNPQNNGSDNPVNNSGNNDTNPITNNNANPNNPQNNDSNNPVNNSGNNDANPATNNNANPNNPQDNNSNNPVNNSRNNDANPVVGNNSANENADKNLSPREKADAEFTSRISAIDTISNPVTKAEQEAQVKTEWAVSIDQEIKEKKAQLSATKDKDEKAQLKNEITQLEQRSVALKNEARSATNVAKQEEQKQQQEQSAAARNAQVTQPIDNNFTSKQTEVAAISDPNEKAQAEQQLYNDWADELGAAADKKDQELAAIKNKKQQEQLKQEIAVLRNAESEKRAEAEAAGALAEEAWQVVPVASNTPQSNPNALVEGGVIFENNTAKTAIANRDEKRVEANELRAKQDSLTQAASKAQGEEKNRLLREATTAQRQAWDKESEASAAQGSANNTQFNDNSSRLNTMLTNASGNSDPGVEVARLKQEEADIMMKQATADRAAAAQATDQFTRSEKLRSAEEKEKQALLKQQEALAAYQKAGISETVVANNTNPATNNNTPNSNNNPVANNPTTTNPDNNTSNNPVTNNNTPNSNNNPVANNPNTTNPDNNTSNNPVPNNPTTTNNTNSNPAATSRAVINPVTGQPYSPEEVTAIKNSEAYQEYSERIAESVAAKQEEQQTEQAATAAQRSGDNNIAKSQDFAGKAADEQDSTKRQQYLDESKRYNELAKQDFKRRDSLNDELVGMRITSEQKQKEADLYLNELDKNTYDQVTAVADSERPSNPVTNNDPITITNTTTPVPNSNQNSSNNSTPTTNNTPDPNNTSRVATQLQPGESFSIQSNAAPTASINVNASLPEGLVYKVQVGAFRNPISPAIFKGIQPLTGEQTTSGLTRYFAGEFKVLNTANAAKNEVRGLGYSDAFVVAFYNGKRISLAEAARMSGQPLPTDATPTNNTPVVTNNNSNASNTPTTNNPPVTNTQTVLNNTPANSTEIAPATDVAAVQGLFYTVQVGVFSRPVSRGQLYNLDGLFSERTANGYLRYSAGKYNNANAAVNSKNSINRSGIRDAFVTAYYNGKRITLDEARTLEAQGIRAEGSADSGTPAPVTQLSNSSNNANNSPATNSSNNAPAVNNSQPTANTSNPTNNNSTNNPRAANLPATPVTAQGIVFSVQMGAFRDEVPVDIANKYLLFASRGVKAYLDAKSGLTVYQMGQFQSYEEAVALKEDAISKGLGDSFVVAWNNGEKISTEEALRLLGR